MSMSEHDAITFARKLIADRCGVLHFRGTDGTGEMVGGEPDAAAAYNALAAMHAYARR